MPSSSRTSRTAPTRGGSPASTIPPGSSQSGLNWVSHSRIRPARVPHQDVRDQPLPGQRRVHHRGEARTSAELVGRQSGVEHEVAPGAVPQVDDRPPQAPRPGSRSGGPPADHRHQRRVERPPAGAPPRRKAARPARVNSAWSRARVRGRRPTTAWQHRRPTLTRSRPGHVAPEVPFGFELSSLPLARAASSTALSLAASASFSRLSGRLFDGLADLLHRLRDRTGDLFDDRLLGGRLGGPRRPSRLRWLLVPQVPARGNRLLDGRLLVGRSPRPRR